MIHRRNKYAKPKAMDLMPALAMRRYHSKPPRRIGLWAVLVVTNITWIGMVVFLTGVTWTSTKLGANVTEFYFREKSRWVEVKEQQDKELEARNMEIARLVAFQTSQSPGDVVQLASKLSTVLNSAYGSQRQFLEKALPDAIRIQVQYGIPASATISQAIYESGYGKSDLARNYHNYFGIKAFNNWSGARASAMPTVDSGVKTRADFRAYASVGEGFEGYAKFLSESGRYEKAFFTPTGDEFVRAILKAGYCPDSTYLPAIRKIMAKHHLGELDDIIKQGSDSPYQSAWSQDGQKEAKLPKTASNNRS